MAAPLTPEVSTEVAWAVEVFVEVARMVAVSIEMVSRRAASAALPVLAALDSIGLHTITTVTTAIGIGMPVIAPRSNPAVVTGDPVWASAASPQSAVNPRWAQWSLQTR
jgi:hypothetical protein